LFTRFLLSWATAIFHSLFSSPSFSPPPASHHGGQNFHFSTINNQVSSQRRKMIGVVQGDQARATVSLSGSTGSKTTLPAAHDIWSATLNIWHYALLV
jgi:hypothetical protein